MYTMLLVDGEKHKDWLSLTIQFAVDKVHSRRKQSLDSRDILGRLLDIHKSDPQKLSFREIIGAVSINVYKNSALYDLWNPLQ